MKNTKYLTRNLKPGAPGSLKPISLMEKYEIQKLRELPIEGVAERLGLTVSHHKALCPFHDDSHPSLSFKTATNRYRCFVCGAHGGPIDLAMKLLPTGRTGKGPFLEACEWLANENNIILTEWKPAEKKPKAECELDIAYLEELVRRPILNAKARDFLFAQRRYNEAVVRWLGISSISYPAPCWRHGKPYYDAPSLLIPYRDVDGKLQSVQSRYLGPTPASSASPPRFRFPRGSTCHIYNLPILNLLTPGEPLFVSEGITDCIGLLSAGHKAIAIPSATLLNVDDMQLLKDHGALNLHIYPDKDQAGEKLYVELLNVANQMGACVTRHSLPDGCKDFSDYWMKSACGGSRK